MRFRFILKLFLFTFFSFLFCFLFFSGIKACGETCYSVVNYCLPDPYQNEITCDSTQNCGLDDYWEIECGPGETALYFSFSCVYDSSCACTPNWSCTEWSPATSLAACGSLFTQTRTCTDLNNCGTTSGKPSESQNAYGTYCYSGSCIDRHCCLPSWSCTEWSPAISPSSIDCGTLSTQYRTCTDLSNCGTGAGKPPEAQPVYGTRCPAGSSCVSGVCQTLRQCDSGPCCDNDGKFRSSSYICNNNYRTEYGCPQSTTCDGYYGKKTYYQKCSGNSSQCNGLVGDNGWEKIKDCQSWESCTASGQNAGCNCNPTCLSNPVLVYPGNNTENIKLPITFKWNPVQGAASYRYTITPAGGNPIQGVIVNTQYTPLPCILKSNVNYTWQISPCCDLAGTNCKNVGTSWSFKTSLSPELINPLNNASSISIPQKLDWCDVSLARSYFLKFYWNTELLYPYPLERQGGALPSETIFGPEHISKNNSYSWEIATCLDDKGKRCGFECQSDKDGQECGEFSQQWKFTTGLITLPPPEIISPKSTEGMPAVNFNTILEWKPVGAQGANSYRYEIAGTEINNFSPGNVTSMPFKSFWVKDNRLLLNFDQVYNLKVRPCWDAEGEKCEATAGELTFKTTGAPPVLRYPANESTGIVIPVKFDWDNMPGAASYKYQISFSENFGAIWSEGKVLNSEAIVDFPVFRTGTQYWWRVKTCADNDAKNCGGSSAQNFTAFELAAPLNPSPSDGGKAPTWQPLTWGKVEGAKFYQYKFDFLSVSMEEKKEICPSLAGKEVVHLTTTTAESLPIYPSLECLGEYRWQARACLDANCEDAGGWSPSWRFSLIQVAPPISGGLIPCGRSYDEPSTPYNERESCQVKHAFLFIKNIIDFILWRLGLIALVLLAAFTGFVFYFSMGNAATMARVKSILKSAGTGYLIIFISWTLINFILMALGFQVEIFGKWWQPPF